MMLRYAAIALALSASFPMPRPSTQLRYARVQSARRPQGRDALGVARTRLAGRARPAAARLLRDPRRPARRSPNWPRARAAASWVVLGRDLTPEYEVTSGKRRLSEQQMAPLRELKIALTPEVVEREKWNAFWDAPLMVPGSPGTSMDLPRKPEEIRRAWATYHATALPGEDRRRAPGSRPFPASTTGNLLRRPALHGLSRDQPAAPGSDRQDRGAVGRL